ncbi:hypothetical protein F4821DRAFT_258440 [Hypoxylon rubiginosum]|uniref:Uncharacterized protein n=1 Tax=Hypoxylon rubiginosum TaxID=110542 RepID=A0ACC0D6J6_9PEZI|nr:hypothetical protein F4821DRAFT_258440 [Hypoxylon rubiginosum]
MKKYLRESHQGPKFTFSEYDGQDRGSLQICVHDHEHSQRGDTFRRTGYYLSRRLVEQQSVSIDTTRSSRDGVPHTSKTLSVVDASQSEGESTTPTKANPRLTRKRLNDA